MVQPGTGQLADWEPLGRGASGIVYRARLVPSGRVVAVKVLAAADPDEMALGRFRREVEAMRAVRHPGVVRVEDVVELDDRIALVTELVDGPPLQWLLPDMHPALAVSILRQLGSPLDAIHAAGVVHRDLKPANVLVDSAGTCRIVDFGVARFVGETYHAPVRNVVRTRTGVVIGTPAYLSPEVIGGRQVDGRADVYSLGVLAYQLLVGRLPFGGGVYEMLRAHATSPPPAPGTLVPGFPDDVAEVLCGALGKLPDDRPATAGELVDRLAQAAAKHWPVADRSELAALSARYRPDVGHDHAGSATRGVTMATATTSEGTASGGVPGAGDAPTGKPLTVDPLVGDPLTGNPLTSERPGRTEPRLRSLPDVPVAEPGVVTLRRGLRDRPVAVLVLAVLLAAAIGAAVALLLAS